jgi:hypothetical protein
MTCPFVTLLLRLPFSLADDSFMKDTHYALTMQQRQVQQHSMNSTQDGYFWQECASVLSEVCFVQTTPTQNSDKTTILSFQKLKPLNNILGRGGININTLSSNEMTYPERKRDYYSVTRWVHNNLRV